MERRGIGPSFTKLCASRIFVAMTRLADCAVAYAFPITQKDYKCSLEQVHSEYAKRFLGRWNQYEPVASGLKSGIQRYRILGVTRLEERVTAAAWQTLFARHSVVILFAHRIEQLDGQECVEFWDSRIDPDAFVELVPGDFAGVIDLSVCGPGVFVEELKRRLPRCTVSYSTEKVSPMIWSEIYGDIFEVLRMRPDLLYEDVATEVILEHRRQVRSRLSAFARRLIRVLGGKGRC
jgi:hypothetical protein